MGCVENAAGKHAKGRANLHMCVCWYPTVMSRLFILLILIVLTAFWFSGRCFPSRGMCSESGWKTRPRTCQSTPFARAESAVSKSMPGSKKNSASQTRPGWDSASTAICGTWRRRRRGAVWMKKSSRTGGERISSFTRGRRASYRRGAKRRGNRGRSI